jgi:hypothetical protein
MPRPPKLETLVAKLTEENKTLSKFAADARYHHEHNRMIIDVLLTKLAEHRLQDVMQMLNGSYDLELVLHPKRK